MSSRPSRGAARLAAILDALPDALLLVNCNGTVVNANHIALETFEVPGTGLVGRGLLSLLPDFDSRRIPGSIRPPDGDARTKPTRMIARRTDGSQFPVEVTSANLEDGRTPYADHQPYTGDELLMIVVRDLTGTLDTEAELARQQRQTEMILRAAAEGVVGVDTAGKIVLLNPSAAQILGYRASDLGGKELHPLIHHSRPDGTPFPYEESPVCDTLRSGRKHRVRGQVLWAKDGRAVPVDLTTAPVRDGDQLVGAVMTFTDRRPYDALAARHAQLQAVLKESLRGPLEQLRAELGTLAADPAGQLWPEANQILHHLSAGYARMTTLVDNVLAYQQLDAGEAKLERETVALDEVVAAGVEGAVELIGPGRAQFAVHAPAIEAEVDAERFAQALAHLIADVAGVDATGNAPAGGAPSGDSTIVVAAAQRGEVVRIEVRGPYAGGDPVHEPIVRGIVRAHGGVLQTHDVPGASGGSAYVLEVPVSAKGGPVSPAATERRSATDTMNATTVMPVPSQRARGTAEAGGGAAPAAGSAAPPAVGSAAGSARAAGPAPAGPVPAGPAGVGAQGGGRRARRGVDGETPGDGGAAQQSVQTAQTAQAPQSPQAPQQSPQQSDDTPPTGRRRAKPRTDEEAVPTDGEGVPGARSNRHGRGGAADAAAGPGGDGDASGLVPPQAQGAPAGPTGRRARREQQPQQQASPQAEGAPRTAFALPPAEADRTPESAPAAAPTGRRARRALTDSPERPIPGQSTGEPAGPRTAFALPPAEADRPQGAGAAPAATGLPGAPRKPADDEAPAGAVHAHPERGEAGRFAAAAGPAPFPGAEGVRGGPAPTPAGTPHPGQGGTSAFLGQDAPAAGGPRPGAAPAPFPGLPGQASGPNARNEAPPAFPAQGGEPVPASAGNRPAPHPGQGGTSAFLGQGTPAAGGPRPGAAPAPFPGQDAPAASGAGHSGQPAPRAPFPGQHGPSPVTPVSQHGPAPVGGGGGTSAFLGQDAPAAPGAAAAPAPGPDAPAPAAPGAAPQAGAPSGPSPYPGGVPAAAAPEGESARPAPGGTGAPADQTAAGVPAPTGRRRARRPLAEEPGAAAAQGGSDTSGRPISVRALGQAAPFAQPGQEPAPAGGSGRRRRLGNPAEGDRERTPQQEPDQAHAQTQAQAPRAAAAAPSAPSAVPSRPPLLDAQEGRAFAIGAPDEGSEGPEPLDGPNSAVEVMNAPRRPMDDELPPEPLDNPRRLLVWPAPDPSTEAALTERGYRPVLVRSREEVDAQTAAYPAALFVDPLTGPITRTALQSLREAAVSAEVPVLVTAGLGQATREAAYGADPAVLLKALAPRDSEMHPPRVLLIEEHEPVADALTATLEQRGMQVARAATDAEAVTLATQVPPNLVVMDLMQVRRRRAGIVDWLRGNGLLKRTPLVVYTSAGIVDPTQFSRLASGETVLFLAERSTSAEVQGRIVDLLSKVGTD
ncbi:PAS domain-containing protein [Streptomyces sp. URMC 127]|uniref:response regulator n=1 Tax=Streptomyces sp. URMC 127 TaxID=3423402 RepID=UPI003F1A6DE8